MYVNRIQSVCVQDLKMQGVGGGGGGHTISLLIHPSIEVLLFYLHMYVRDVNT